MLLYILDLFGTVVFAISGVWLACRKDMDLFGAMVLAFVTAVGGGTIRDVLLSSTPVFWIQDTLYLLVILATTLFAILVRQWHERSKWILQVSDALGLAVFVVIGVTKSLSFGVEPMVAVMMGVLTGCGGGAIRDMLAGEIPMVLRQEIYASAAMAGGAVFILLEPLLQNINHTSIIAAAVVLILRLMAVYKGLSLPRFGLPV
ncbi:trimeric intracellular cation channel family protein [Endozoicomonas sp. GU-1]|uniref:trimeric intracellular cation channel family protein n=1 Tax=Endozoicomonas sp. GU-1 TaxID=3009078 RepID=UPI0022B4E55D|nr:trimeric intracellular cation channel family protein [Endozoicomonas sp. GU-1]WBA81021.1 trimeric intracellular cation channel family protein [Endozoicomonas sp. GU-1]WBA88589.1 trimeric intracellular cation channel family protein [Endozoicomonas sp. GU-1]